MKTVWSRFCAHVTRLFTRAHIPKLLPGSSRALPPPLLKLSKGFKSKRHKGRYLLHTRAWLTAYTVRHPVLAYAGLSCTNRASTHSTVQSHSRSYRTAPRTAQHLVHHVRHGYPSMGPGCHAFRCGRGVTRNNARSLGARPSRRRRRNAPRFTPSPLLNSFPLPQFGTVTT